MQRRGTVPLVEVLKKLLFNPFSYIKIRGKNPERCINASEKSLKRGLCPWSS